jgi:hypothetical protein
MNTITDPYSGANVITLYCLFANEALSSRVSYIDGRSFYVIHVDDISEIPNDEKRPNPMLVLLDSETFKNNKKTVTGWPEAVVINGADLHLTYAVTKTLPTELFMTAYLEEFLFWCVEQQNYKLKFDRRKPKINKIKLENSLQKLQKLSRQSLSADVKQGG